MLFSNKLTSQIDLGKRVYLGLVFMPSCSCSVAMQRMPDMCRSDARAFSVFHIVSGIQGKGSLLSGILNETYRFS